MSLSVILNKMLYRHVTSYQSSVLPASKINKNHTLSEKLLVVNQYRDQLTDWTTENPRFFSRKGHIFISIPTKAESVL